MQNTPVQNKKLPYSCTVLCVSLIGASLILILIYTLYSMAYISGESAIWAAIGVFVVAASYESFLVFIMTRHMINKVSKGS